MKYHYNGIDTRNFKDGMKTYLKIYSLLLLCLPGLICNAWADFEAMPHHEQFFEQQKVDCAQSASKEWDNTRNACITKQDVKDRRDEINECAGIENAEARKKCHEKVAERETGVGAGEGSGGGPGVLAVAGVTTALTAAMMVASEKLGSSCTSRNIFAGTSVVGLAAEFFYINSAKKKLEELQEAYKKETAQPDAYHAQKRAFEFLKEEQLLIKEFEEKRRNALYVMAAGYGAAGIYAVVEGKTRMGAPCDPKKEKPKQEDSATVDNNPDTTAQAKPEVEAEAKPAEAPKTGDGKPIPPQTAAVAKASGMAMLDTPMAIAISSGVAGGASLFLATAAGKQAKLSGENADAVQKIIDQFEADFGQFCPQGREDLKDAACYCYNLDGSENSKRKNSNVCLELWAQRKKNLFAGAGSYANPTGKIKRKGCAFINSQFDEECRCRQMLNPQGQNACLKIGIPGGTLGQLGRMSSFPTAIGNLNNMAQGGLGTGEFNPQSLAQNAVAMTSAARRALEEEFAKNSNGRKLPPSEAMLSAGLSRIPKRVLDKLSSNNIGAAALAASSRPQSAALDSALAKARLADPALSSLAYAAPKGGAKAGAKAAADNMYFDDWGSSADNSGGGDILNFMEKNYEYNQNDIVQRDDVSLWQIISNRYTQSGLRRLFGEEGEL